MSESTPVVRKLELLLDQADYDTIQNEIARYQMLNRWPEGGTLVPEGESNLPGAILAEVCRNLAEYRDAPPVTRLQ